MPFLLRVELPDVPGSLGRVATAIGEAGGDIEAIEIVEHRPDGTAVDDVLLETAPGVMPDSLVSACNQLDGVHVLWVSRYAAGGNLFLDLEAVEQLTAAPGTACDELVDLLPMTFRADWALRLRGSTDGPVVVHRTSAAPETITGAPGWFPLVQAARLDLPADWQHLESTLVAGAPLHDGDDIVLFGRRGGPEVLDSELRPAPAPRCARRLHRQDRLIGLPSAGMDMPMSMNRVIHAAVRRDLARLESALDRAPDGDRGRAEGLGRAYGHLHEELTRHHEGEDELIFPMLAGFDVDPILLKEMESEHEAMAEALEQTDAAMSEYAATGSAASAARAKESVTHARHVVERHLDHEEHELEPLFFPHEDSPEWKAVERKLRKAPPGVAGRFFAWLEDGMEPKERDYLAATVPAPVRFVLSKGFGRAYHRDIAPVWKAS